MIRLSNAQIASLGARVDGFAASLHAAAVPLENASFLYQTGTSAHSPQNFTGNVYVATPQLLAAYGSRPARSLPAPTTSRCGRGWRACRTWR